MGKPILERTFAFVLWVLLSPLWLGLKLYEAMPEWAQRITNVILYLCLFGVAGWYLLDAVRSSRKQWPVFIFIGLLIAAWTTGKRIVQRWKGARWYLAATLSIVTVAGIYLLWRCPAIQSEDGIWTVGEIATIFIVLAALVGIGWWWHKGLEEQG